jgi:hypothetical protein
MRFLCFMFLKNKRSEGGAVGVVLIQFSKRFRPVAENGNKEHHLRSPLEASSQLQKNVIVVVGCSYVRIIPIPILRKSTIESYRACKVCIDVVRNRLIQIHLIKCIIKMAFYNLILTLLLHGQSAKRTKHVVSKVAVLLDSSRQFRVSSSYLKHFAREETVLL